MTRTAIIGGGPSGLVAARYLKAHGAEPIVFEQSGRIGGQWAAGAAHSGVWAGMRTNTSRVLSRFSDLAHSPGVPVYPSAAQMEIYLQRYAEEFDLSPHVSLKSAVRTLARDPAGGWRLEGGSPNGDWSETFERVVVASGRYNKPKRPEVAGLDSFPGHVGHAFDYEWDREAYRGVVLVVGSSISALEIAGDLAMTGADRVVSSARRQRYVLQKMIAGKPTDHLAFNRFAALAATALPMEAQAAALKAFVVGGCGSPEQFGAFAPADNVFEAGFTQAQHYLPLVAEGRIIPRPDIERIEGRVVHFKDGSHEEPDAILFGTGYELNLPFLSPEVAASLDLDADHMDLFAHTFHPALEGVAFLGQFAQIGPYLPVLELQARWVAYRWAGLAPAPTAEAVSEGLATCRAGRGGSQEAPMHAYASLFAHLAGVEPDTGQWPTLKRALLFGPLSPASYRLSGPDAAPEAVGWLEKDAAAFQVIDAPDFTDMELAQLGAVGHA